MKSTTKANKAFLAKLATITVGTGVKAPTCATCGGSKLKLIGMGVAIVRERRPKREASEEQAFAA